MGDQEPLCLADELPRDAHPDIRKIRDYWRRMGGGGARLPARRQLDPADIVALLPSVWLFDVVPTPAGPRFRYRLQGTHIVRMLGRSSKGRWIDEADPVFPGSQAEASMRFCVAEKRPHWRRGAPVLFHAERFGELERVIMPLASDGANPDMLLGLTVFYDLAGMPLTF